MVSRSINIYYCCILMFARSRVHRYVSGVPGAVFTRHSNREDANNAFDEAQRHRITRLILTPGEQEIIEISDTESEDEI